MPKKQWDNDGPRRSAQGYQWDWRYLETIMRESALSAQARAEQAEWWRFLHSHPTIKSNIKRAMQESNLSYETIADNLRDLIKRHVEEQRRRKKVLEV
jgi:hypothetical protein